MCIAVPGKIIHIEPAIDDIFRVAKVSFNGIVKQVNLAMVPGANTGDYVLVHVGNAISIVNEIEANRTMELLMQISSLNVKDE